MGRKWNNIKEKKASKDASTSRIYAKFGREIYVAAKQGEPDPESNRALKVVLERAKTYSVPGAAVNRYTLHSEKQLIQKHFNSLTAENEMKFEQIQPREGQFNFDYADELIHVSEQFGHKLRGHTLVWHNQTSDWVVLV